MTYAVDPIVSAFDRLAGRRPSAPLVVSPSRSASVADVDSLSRALETVLRDVGAEPGALVGLSAPNGPAFLAGLLALRRAGLVVVLLDPHAPDADKERACLAVGARAVLVCDTLWPEDAAPWRRRAVAGVPTALPARDVAVVKMTSGSTGAPRGVAASAEAVLADDAALARTMGFRDDDRIVGAIPMSHSYGFSSVALPALVRGSVVVMPDNAGPLAPLAAAVHAEATVFPTAPAYLQALVKLSRPPDWPRSVRLVISAGAPLSADTAARFRAAYGRSVHVFYGASECGGICYDREGTAAERGTVGTPVDGVKVTLEAVDTLGAPGEGMVTVSSPAVAAGYLPQAEPRLGGGRFQAGDLAAWDGGELRLCGRVDGLINVKGKKVSPTEIEAVLQRLPGVEEAVAMGVPAPDRASELVRAVVACPSGSLTYEQVVTWCRRHLSDHKVPRSVVLVAALPRTPRGKLDRAELLRLVPEAEP